MNLFEKLSTYPSIAWDFDQTLVDSEASPMLHAFIKKYPDINHYICTFRTHGMAAAIPYDLRRYPNAPNINVFKEILHISEEAWLANDQCFYKRKQGLLRGPLTEPELYYRTWKGMICHQHSIPVLVDDDFENTYRGCEKYGIKLIDPLDLVDLDYEVDPDIED